MIKHTTKPPEWYICRWENYELESWGLIVGQFIQSYVLIEVRLLEKIKVSLLCVARRFVEEPSLGCEFNRRGQRLLIVFDFNVETRLLSLNIETSTSPKLTTRKTKESFHSRFTTNLSKSLACTLLPSAYPPMIVTPPAFGFWHTEKPRQSTGRVLAYLG